MESVINAILLLFMEPVRLLTTNGLKKIYNFCLEKG